MGMDWDMNLLAVLAVLCNSMQWLDFQIKIEFSVISMNEIYLMTFIIYKVFIKLLSFEQHQDSTLDLFEHRSFRANFA